jgi:hypothetical protein
MLSAHAHLHNILFLKRYGAQAMARAKPDGYTLLSVPDMDTLRQKTPLLP